jgi:hypothetical protein
MLPRPCILCGGRRAVGGESEQRVDTTCQACGPFMMTSYAANLWKSQDEETKAKALPILRGELARARDAGTSPFLVTTDVKNAVAAARGDRRPGRAEHEP